MSVESESWYRMITPQKNNSVESTRWTTMSSPLFNSGYEDNEFYAFGQSGFQEVLNSFLAQTVQIYNKKISLTPTSVKAVIQNNTSDVYNSTVTRQILCAIGTLACGQYVKVGSQWWIVSAMPDNNGIYEKAVLWKCKHTLKFRSPVTGDIVSYPVYSQNSTQYGTGEKNSETIVVGEDKHTIYIPYNEETVLIDDNFRFMIDRNTVNPNVYRVTKVDPVSYAVGEEYPNDGLLQWSVVETQFDELRDSREYMVADYYVQSSGSDEPGEGENVEIRVSDADGNYQIVVGETKTLNVLYKLNGTEQTDLSGLTVTVSEGASFVTVSGITNKQITMRALNYSENVGETVTVEVADEENDVTAEIHILIVDW